MIYPIYDTGMAIGITIVCMGMRFIVLFKYIWMKSSSDYILLENEVTEEGEYTKTVEWEGL